MIDPPADWQYFFFTRNIHPGKKNSTFFNVLTGKFSKLSKVLKIGEKMENIYQSWAKLRTVVWEIGIWVSWFSNSRTKAMVSSNNKSLIGNASCRKRLWICSWLDNPFQFWKFWKSGETWVIVGNSRCACILTSRRAFLFLLAAPHSSGSH